MGKRIDWVKRGLARGFTFDGCTNAPDLTFKTCCDRHDYHYQDLKLPKWRADALLAKCMWKRGDIPGKLLAPIYWSAVTLFGHFYWKRKQNESIAKIGTPDEFVGGPIGSERL